MRKLLNQNLYDRSGPDIEKEGLQVLVEPALNYTVSTYDKEDKDRKMLRKCMKV